MRPAAVPQATVLERVEGNKQYLLFPNPNDGNFTILAETGVEEPVNIVVLNAVGAAVHKTTLRFERKKAPVSIGQVASGIYLVQLTDARGQRSTFKFTVQ